MIALDSLDSAANFSAGGTGVRPLFARPSEPSPAAFSRGSASSFFSLSPPPPLSVESSPGRADGQFALYDDFLSVGL